jgi:hypothetical protein
MFAVPFVPEPTATMLNKQVMCRNIISLFLYVYYIHLLTYKWYVPHKQNNYMLLLVLCGGGGGGGGGGGAAGGLITKIIFRFRESRKTKFHFHDF